MAITDEVIERSFKGVVLTIKWRKSGEFKYIKAHNNGWLHRESTTRVNDKTQEFLNEQLEIIQK